MASLTSVSLPPGVIRFHRMRGTPRNAGQMDIFHRPTKDQNEEVALGHIPLSPAGWGGPRGSSFSEGEGIEAL